MLSAFSLRNADLELKIRTPNQRGSVAGITASLSHANPKKMWSNVCNFSNLGEKMQTLKSKMEYLSCLECDVKVELKHAELRSRKKRKRVVEDWLVNVEKNRNEFENLEEEVQISRFLQKFQLRNRADKMIGEVEELIVEGRCFVGLVMEGRSFVGLLLDHDDKKGMPLLTEKLIGHQFEQNLYKVRDCLMKDDILRIGIYGMGGSGKTALATHVHNLLLQNSETSDFHVYWLTVSQDWSVDKLQNNIANILGLDLSNEDVRMKRAAKLSEAMTRKRKSVLILDDVWEKFSLLHVGIPYSMDGCKLIFTTRSLEVCRKMGCQLIIRVGPLLEDEAWNLFMEKLGHGMTLPSEVIEIAMSIAKRCCGLPLTIITMARSMMGVKDIHEWRNALEELKESITQERRDGSCCIPDIK